MFLCALILSGCAHRPPPGDSPDRSGATEIEDFQPESREPDDRPPPLVIPPQALERPLPAYPETALADHVACTARVLFHVEPDGSVRLVRLEWDIPPPDEHVEAFESVIREVIPRWDYVPATRIEPRERPDGSIESKFRKIPKAQHSRIRFRVERGRGVVE